MVLTMINAKEVNSKRFEKAAFGYKQEDVDDYLRELSIEIAQLIKEKEDCDKKLDVLADKIRDYMKDEDALKDALLGAQRQGHQVVEEAKQKAEKILAELSNVKSIENASKASNVKIDTVSHISFALPTFVSATNASEPIIGALASKTDAGKFVAPKKGNNGVYMFKVLSKSKTAEKFDEVTEENTLSNTAMRNATNNIINDLYIKADIKDNRYKFF